MLVLLITGILKYKDKVGWGGIPLIDSHKNEVTVARGEDGCQTVGTVMWFTKQQTPSRTVQEKFIELHEDSNSYA